MRHVDGLETVRVERAGLLRVEFGGATVLDVAGLRGYTGATSVAPHPPCVVPQGRVGALAAQAPRANGLTS